jgi:hypothetical protein
MKTLPPEALDALFDSGEDIGPYLDPNSAVKINAPQRIYRSHLKICTNTLRAVKPARRLSVSSQLLQLGWV